MPKTTINSSAIRTLAELHREAEFRRPRPANFFDVAESLLAVDRRLPGAEHVQIRSVQDQDDGHVRHGVTPATL